MADVIRRCSPEGSCCARLGGDEFAVLVPTADNKRVNSSVANIIRSIAETLTLGTATVHVSASVGISRIERGMTPEDCLRRSDIAMYSAKRAGRNCKIWFDDRMEQELLARTQLEDEIRDAVEAGEFVPYYQPQMDLGSSHLTGFEVLARWNSPTKGLLEPSAFMDVAEASGMISELSLSVMVQALTEAQGLAKPSQDRSQHFADPISRSASRGTDFEAADGNQFPAFAPGGRNHRILVPRGPGDLHSRLC